MNNRGVLGGLTQTGLALAIFGIVLMVAVTVVAQFQNTNVIYNGSANETANAVLGAYSSLTNWLPVIIIVIVSALILGLVMRSFGGGGAVGR